MIAALLLSSLSLGDGLPARPVQSADDIAAAIAGGECPEGVAKNAPRDCRGIVLPLIVWAHLEQLAEDSRTVRHLYDREAFRAAVELDAQRERVAWLEAELEAERQPVPILRGPGAMIGASMVAGAAAVLLGAAAIQMIGE